MQHQINANMHNGTNSQRSSDRINLRVLDYLKEAGPAHNVLVELFYMQLRLLLSLLGGHLSVCMSLCMSMSQNRAYLARAVMRVSHRLGSIFVEPSFRKEASPNTECTCVHHGCDFTPKRSRSCTITLLSVMLPQHAASCSTSNCRAES